MAPCPNVLVIEAKKLGNDTRDDEEKLNLYRSQLHYHYAALMIFYTGVHPGIEIVAS